MSTSIRLSVILIIVVLFSGNIKVIVDILLDIARTVFTAFCRDLSSSILPLLLHLVEVTNLIFVGIINTTELMLFAAWTMFPWILPFLVGYVCRLLLVNLDNF
ncbi:hypothetical protein F4804DRAFT_198895 [Jackrogersella minutella]|nr:hypothetical protein F4804DRAFT_198895 [Jackrogersella minutella]